MLAVGDHAMTLVLPWAIWASASSRPYPYGTEGFLAMITIGLICLTVILTVGFLLIRTHKLFPQKVEYKYFGAAMLAIAISGYIHALGNVLFYFTNDSRVIINLGTNVVLYFYPTTTSLAVMGTFLAYIFIYFYGIRKLEKIRPLDYAFIVLGIAGIILSLSPYNWWHMIKPTGAFDTKPMTGIFLLIVGLLSVYKFYTSLRTRLGQELRTLPAGSKRVKLVAIALFLLLVQVILMIRHSMLADAATYYEWARAAMIIVTYAKLLSLALFALLLYSGLTWPKWVQRIFGK